MRTMAYPAGHATIPVAKRCRGPSISPAVSPRTERR
jgi:hypothetical protein